MTAERKRQAVLSDSQMFGKITKTKKQGGTPKACRLCVWGKILVFCRSDRVACDRTLAYMGLYIIILLYLYYSRLSKSAIAARATLAPNRPRGSALPREPRSRRIAQVKARTPCKPRLHRTVQGEAHDYRASHACIESLKGKRMTTA